MNHKTRNQLPTTQTTSGSAGRPMRLGLRIGMAVLACVIGLLGLTQAPAGELGSAATSTPHLSAAGITQIASVSRPGEASKPTRVLTPRQFAATWHDGKGTLWMFGGHGVDGYGRKGMLNELWQWNGNAWILLAGSMEGERPGVYPAMPGAQPQAMPGARIHPEAWMGDDGKLWLYGGFGRDANGRFGNLNDLWNWDGQRWTWVGGSKTIVAFQAEAIMKAATAPR